MVHLLLLLLCCCCTAAFSDCSDSLISSKASYKHPLQEKDQTQRRALASEEGPPDIIAVLPDRSTAYPNGVHNGLQLTARALNLTLAIKEVGNFDPETSANVLRELIAAREQPSIYLVWPIDYPSRLLLKELYQTHQIPIIQMNQLPDANSQWEWDHLVGYTGPDDALRASNAGKMMLDAMEERQIESPRIAALGYPETYGGYHLSIAAFEQAISAHPNLTLLEPLPLDWGTQPAYAATLQLLDTYGSSLQGIYAMDDNILLGVYQALQDHPSGSTPTLVGTVCNGARQLLETKAQYGTTVQGPYLEGDLAVRAAAEYLFQNKTTKDPFVRFTPNPIATAETWEKMFVDYMGESYTADELCTWTIPYERVAGVEEVDNVDDICAIVPCDYIPRSLVYTGLSMCAINYALALMSILGLFLYRKKKIIQLAQPFFLLLIVLGTMVDNASIILMSQDNYNRESSPDELDHICFAIPWVLALGHMLTTATLVAKIYRVKKVIGTASRRFRKAREVTVREVMFFIAAFLSVDIVLLTLWSILDPMRWEMGVLSYDQTGYIGEARGECSWTTEYGFVFPLAISLFHLATLIYANVLAYQTRDYHKLSDSKCVAIALFNSIQLLVVVSPLLVVVRDNVGVSYFVSVCFVFLNNVGVLLLVVIPKIFQCLRGEGDVMPDLYAMSQRANFKSRVDSESRIDSVGQLRNLESITAPTTNHSDPINPTKARSDKSVSFNLDSVKSDESSGSLIRSQEFLKVLPDARPNAEPEDDTQNTKSADVSPLKVEAQASAAMLEEERDNQRAPKV